MDGEFHPAMQGFCIILDNNLYRLTGEFVFVGHDFCPMCEDLEKPGRKAYPRLININKKMFDSDSRINILESVL